MHTGKEYSGCTTVIINQITFEDDVTRWGWIAEPPRPRYWCRNVSILGNAAIASLIYMHLACGRG